LEAICFAIDENVESRMERNILTITKLPEMTTAGKKMKARGPETRYVSHITRLHTSCVTVWKTLTIEMSRKSK
jgi:hypothetical protein